MNDQSPASPAAQEDFEYIPDQISDQRRLAGKWLMRVAFGIFALMFVTQGLFRAGVIDFGFENWRPVLYAYLGWAVALGFGQVITRGEDGYRALFILPAILFTISVVVVPTLFGLAIAFTDYNLASFEGQKFNGFDNIVQLVNDSFFWNAMRNMVFYVAAVFVEYAIAFGLALLLNADIKARKFFRIAFLLPFMLSPVAVSWMIGKSLMENRFGPIAKLARYLGWDRPSFFTNPWVARGSIEVMDAWVSIPFIMILLLAGLQAMPKDVIEAAKVDGANAWQNFWKITFPLMLPVSATAIVLRIIFKLKLADIVINVTSGGPGGATDTLSSFIFREYRDRSNVGYGTMIAIVYLITIIIFITLLLGFVSKRMQKMT